MDNTIIHCLLPLLKFVAHAFGLSYLLYNAPFILGKEEAKKNPKMATSSTVSRGAQTMNTMFFKPMLRKSYHRKSGSSETTRETLKMDAEEVKSKSHEGSTHGSTCWVPDNRTGIFYPKGQEKVMADVPPGAANFAGVNWFSYDETL